jgi:hypothetical protein
MATTETGTDELDEVGTIDSLLIEFPRTEITGELVPPLLDLVNRRLVRLLDALIVVKGADGSVQSLTTEDLDPAMVGELAGASSGLLDEEDATAAAAVLEPGTSGLLLVYENLWSIPFSVAVRKAGGQLVASDRIPVQALLARLDALEA